jgi:hypothetical protein
MAMYLFHVEQKNRLEQKGLLKRFTLTCYGKQETLEEIRATKARKYEELKSGKNAREFEEWFLKYNPSMNRGLKRVASKKSVSHRIEKTYVIPNGRNKTVRFSKETPTPTPLQAVPKTRRRKQTKKRNDSWPYGKRVFKKWI